MNKKTWIIVVAVLVVVVGLVVYFAWSPMPSQPGQTPAAVSFDPMNAAYTIDGQPVRLVNGQSVTTDAATVTTKIFGEPVLGDLNGDGKPDAVVFLTQDGGGSGTFYYAAAAIDTGNGAQGTNAILLGDRIAPQTISITNGKITVNYADRKPTDPFSTQPSIGVSRYMTVQSSTTLLSENAIVGAGGACGGNMTTAPTCQTGFHCAPNPGSHLPFGDVGGTCVAN